jgi:hypothetical protein
MMFRLSDRYNPSGASKSDLIIVQLFYKLHGYIFTRFLGTKQSDNPFILSIPFIKVFAMTITQDQINNFVGLAR